LLNNMLIIHKLHLFKNLNLNYIFKFFCIDDNYSSRLVIRFDNSILFSYPKKWITDGRLLIVDLITMSKINNYPTLIWILMFMLMPIKLWNICLNVCKIKGMFFWKDIFNLKLEPKFDPKKKDKKIKEL
jgi:hypothetical protein